MLYIKNYSGQFKPFVASLIHNINNYKIYKLLKYNTFYIFNIKNYNINGFILNPESSEKDKGYYYYNLKKQKVFYLNCMRNDTIHHSDIKDMTCITIEILNNNKIEYLEKLMSSF